MQIFVYFAPWNSKNTGWLVDIYIFKNLSFQMYLRWPVCQSTMTKTTELALQKQLCLQAQLSALKEYNIDVSAYSAPILGTIPLWRSIIIKKNKIIYLI